MFSVNQRLLSGPEVIPAGKLSATDRLYSAMIEPAVVIFPILFSLFSVNHRLLSGPVVIPYGKLSALGKLYSVIEPPVVIFPILFPLLSAK